jgi:hypothetical protein
LFIPFVFSMPSSLLFPSGSLPVTSLVASMTVLFCLCLSFGSCLLTSSWNAQMLTTLLLLHLHFCCSLLLFLSMQDYSFQKLSQGLISFSSLCDTDYICCIML